jgi:hypothetical protein
MSDELNRRSRDTEADLKLRAHRHPLEELAEDVGDVSITLVAAVVTHPGAKKA